MWAGLSENLQNICGRRVWKIWGSVLFGVENTQAFLIWKLGVLVISQQTCFYYSLAMSWLAFLWFPWQQGFLICKAEYCIWFEGVYIFFITVEILIHASWSGTLLFPHTSLNNLCFALKITHKCEFLFDKNPVTSSNFWHSIRHGGKFLKL